MAGSSRSNDVNGTVPASLVVKNEMDEAEINAMALNMKKALKKLAASEASKLKPLSTAGNVYINRNGRPVPVLTEISCPPDPMDANSIKRRFGWHTIGRCNLPYITRLINCEEVKFSSVRIAETQLLFNYLRNLHTEIYTCTSVTSFYITLNEAVILDDINLNHCDKMYGETKFVAGKDCIVKLEDVHEFYLFIEFCHKRLLGNYTPGRHEKCGFIRINSESVVAYCVKDNKKYIPLFYFEGETDELQTQAIKFENWDLAYLKFCCKFQGIRNEIFATDSCLVTCLQDVKSYFHQDTTFEDFWPTGVADKTLLISQNSSRVNPPGSWALTPTLGLNTADNEHQHHPLLPPAAVPLPSMPMGMNSYQNGWPSNQLNSAILQQSNSNHDQMNIQPPPVRSDNIAITTQTISNHAPYPINQSMTTMPNNAMANGNYSNSQQYFGAEQQQQIQQQQQQLQQQQWQYQQQQRQQSYGPIIVKSERRSVVSSNPLIGKTERKGVARSSPRIGNTQQRNALRRTTVAPPTSEIIDLVTPPSSPEPSAGPSSSSNTVISNPVVLELQRIPETSNSVAYKIQTTIFQGKKIQCIKAVAFNSELLVTLQDFVQTMFPTVTVKRCAEVLTKYLNVTMYMGNSDQMALLRKTNRIQYPDATPMVMLKDVNTIFRHLKDILHKPDEDIQQS